MKILTVYHKYKRGGSYHRFRMMLDAYVEAGDEVYYIAVERYPFELPGVHPQIFYAPSRDHGSNIFKFYFLLLAPLYTAYVCHKNRIDLLVAFGATSAFIQSFARLLLRKKMIALIRGDSEHGLRVSNAGVGIILLNRLLERIGLFFCDRIVVNNRDQKRKIETRVSKHRGGVQILCNDVPLFPDQTVYSKSVRRRASRKRKQEFLIATVGVINRGKNIELLLYAIRNLGMSGMSLLVVGDVIDEGDDSKRRLEELARDLNINHQVAFTGWKEGTELHKCFDRADLFVFPSFYEGSPNALLEALGHDKPCLGSRVPGISDVLYFDELLFDPYDGRELLEKIERAILDGKYLEKILDLSMERRKAFTFDWKKALLDMTRTLS